MIPNNFVYIPLIYSGSINIHPQRPSILECTEGSQGSPESTIFLWFCSRLQGHNWFPGTCKDSGVPADGEMPSSPVRVGTA